MVKVNEATQSKELMTDFRLGVLKLNGLLLRQSENSLEKSSLTRSRSLLLGIIARSDKPMTMSDVARESGQTRQGVGRMVNILIKDGYLSYSKNPNHVSSKLLRLTAKGKSEFAKVLELHEKLSEDQPVPVADAQLQVALGVIEQLITHLEENEIAY